MKISTKGIYALEVAVDLSIYASREKLESIKNIAARRKLSEKYLDRIVGLLKKEGLVESIRGAYGGYYLAREPKDISVLDVLTAAEGDLAPVECLSKETDCGIDCDTCPTRNTWNHMWDLLRDSIKETTIEDIKKLVLDK